jgi:hypothetical protein
MCRATAAPLRSASANAMHRSCFRPARRLSLCAAVAAILLATSMPTPLAHGAIGGLRMRSAMTTHAIRPGGGAGGTVITCLPAAGSNTAIDVSVLGGGGGTTALQWLLASPTPRWSADACEAQLSASPTHGTHKKHKAEVVGLRHAKAGLKLAPAARSVTLGTADPRIASYLPSACQQPLPCGRLILVRSASLDASDSGDVRGRVFSSAATCFTGPCKPQRMESHSFSSGSVMLE